MVLYAILMFLFSAVLILSGAIVATGKYENIYDYYICAVNDLKGYAKAHGIAMMCMSLPLIACGICMLVGPEIPTVLIGLGILLVGIIVGYVAFYKIQEKYNGGMF